jgi:molybdopterin/thiamine biosynthesis adenylyltransferase
VEIRLKETGLERYQRQMLLPQIGRTGQERLASSRVLLVGCGALGTTIADQLVRSGVGHLTIADRDIVELTNLQRQTLFDESDAAAETPKAVAAAKRLTAVNSTVEIAPLVTDIHAGNIEDLVNRKFDLILDGTDNVQTRYLLNDVSVKHDIPWIYGAAVATEGRVMGIVPRVTACLRCIFPQPPRPQDLPTCDTAGVLGMGAAIVGAYQAIEALRILTGQGGAGTLMRLEFWPPRMHVISTAEAKAPDCPCCGRRAFEFLEARSEDTAVLCGRNAVQVRPVEKIELNLDRLGEKLRIVGEVHRTAYFVKCRLNDPANVTLTIFPDGRSLVAGVTDPGRAKSLHARFVGC